jgi:hypothetical protein
VRAGPLACPRDTTPTNTHRDEALPHARHHPHTTPRRGRAPCLPLRRNTTPPTTGHTTGGGAYPIGACTSGWPRPVQPTAARWWSGPRVRPGLFVDWPRPPRVGENRPMRTKRSWAMADAR